MKYIIMNKWQLKDSNCKPNYYLKKVVNNLEQANRLIELYQLTETDPNDTYYIVPFDENTLVLTEEVA